MLSDASQLEHEPLPERRGDAGESSWGLCVLATMPPKIRHDSESSCGVKGVRCVGGSDSSIEKENLSSFFFSILFQIPLTQLTNLTLREIDKTKEIMRPKVFEMTAKLV